MDKQDKIEQLKKVLTKASSIEKGKEIAVAKEFIQIDDKIDSTKEEIGGKLDKIIEDVVTPVNQEVSITGSEIVTIRGKDGRDGKDGERGEKGEKGDRGDAGKDGLDGYVGRDGIDGLPGRDGLDGRDGKDGATGLQGKPGKDGKDGITEIPEKVIKKTLKKIGYDSLKGGENLIDRSHLDKAVSILDSRTSFLINKINNLPAGGGGGTWGSITGTLSDQTDLQSALDAKGSGTVTSVSVTTANGVSGSVATATTTPAITLTLGAITPSSIDAGSGAITTTGNVSGNNWLGTTAVRAGATSFFYWSTLARMYSPADGVIRLTDNAATSFDRLQFGGTTSSFPAIKRNGAAINFRLADDSAAAAVTALTFNGVALVTGGTATKYLSEDGTYTTPAGGGGITIGTTTITSGTSTRILYNNAGVVGEYTLTGTGAVVAMQTAPSFLNGITVADTVIAGSGSLAGSLISGTQTWNTTGSPTSILLDVTNTASGANAKLIDLKVGGVSQFNVSKAGVVTTTGIIESASQVRGSSFRITLGNSYIWNTASQMKSSVDGIIVFQNSAGSDFNRLQWGGTTSSFPSIKRSSAILQARLADDSAYTDLEVADEAYGVGWNGSVEVPTKNAVYDKIETVIAGAGANTALSNLASVAINTTLVSDTNNTDDLGTTAVKWANLYVTNIGATATRTTKGWFTDIESTNMPTVGGTAILTSLTAPQFTTIELGHATANTLSASGGVLSIEGKAIPNLTDGGTFLADISVPAEAYSSTWNGSNEVPTKNDVYDADFYKDDWSKIFAGLGSTILFRTIGAGDINFGSNALVDGVAYYAAVYISKATTITGLKWYQSIQGNYTADNNNYVALYSYSGGTMTQVAISTNDGDIWKVASNTFGSAAFTTPFAASPGVYFIGALWNASATVTAPLIGQYANSINAAIQSYDFTNSAKVYSTVSAQTTLPATQAMSGTTGVLNGRWFGLY